MQAGRVLPLLDFLPYAISRRHGISSCRGKGHSPSPVGSHTISRQRGIPSFRGRGHSPSISPFAIFPSPPEIGVIGSSSAVSSSPDLISLLDSLGAFRHPYALLSGLATHLRYFRCNTTFPPP